MDKSIFMNKQVIPTHNDLAGALADTCDLWQRIVDYVHLKYPAAVDEWNYSGANYGWSFRTKDKKRAIIYLLPRDGYFKAAFVFGQKATDRILESQVSEAIKSELNSARIYAEGRGIRIEITDKTVIKDIKALIDIKIAN
ncbi:MAG: DUF3788 domain-containing protein [Bacteroidota bacterium]|nr:DUF3788 domain-containing protein [Bacteroidota bacterium]